MFEKTFVDAKRGDKKPYTLVVSLLLQITTLAALVIVPLIYTRVLPELN